MTYKLIIEWTMIHEGQTIVKTEEKTFESFQALMHFLNKYVLAMLVVDGSVLIDGGFIELGAIKSIRIE